MTEKMFLWLARRLPRRLRYWVVITEAANYSAEHPHAEVPRITWADICRD